MPQHWLDNFAPAGNVLESDPGPIAMIEYSDDAEHLIEAMPAPKGAPQYEVFNGSITAGASATFDATREPDQWTVYLVTATNADVARVNLGQGDGGPWVYLQYRAIARLPGRGLRLVVTGVTLAGATTVVAIASSNLPVEVQPA